MVHLCHVTLCQNALLLAYIMTSVHVVIAYGDDFINVASLYM